MNTTRRPFLVRGGEAHWVAFLILLGGVLVATMPPPAESFPLSQDFSTFTRFAVGSSTVATMRNGIGDRPKKVQRTFIASRRRPRGSSKTLLSAYFSLTTALESLWEKRIVENLWKKQMDNGADEETDDYRCLSWLDLDGSKDGEETDRGSKESDDSTTVVSLPLYPINDVYLPSAVNHTLYNVEPQNIQMALNLLSEMETTEDGSQSSPRFCVVLRARDTGRVASIANVLRIVDADVQRIPTTRSTANDETNGSGSGNSGDDDDDDDDDDISNILRIKLTCRSEGLAEIESIENGSGWAEKRVLRSREYLRATVRPLNEGDDDDGGGDDEKGSWKDSYNAIRADLRTIKLIYQLQLGGEEFPPDTLLRLGNAMKDFPELRKKEEEEEDDDDELGDALLWELAQEWQSVCMTLRQGTEAWLSADRNEKLVAAARAKGGGILKLPIHLSELDPEDRKDIQKLDQEAQEKHKAFGMDPVLDFQVLIGLPTTGRRFGFLARLVNRERRRLEDIASSYSSWS